MEQTGKWYRAANFSEIEDDDVLGVTLGEEGEHEIAVYKLGGKCYATADRCTHQSVRLSDGLVIDNFIECPLHQGRFDIATGKARGAPVSVALRIYPTKVEEGVVHIFVGDLKHD